MFQCRPFPMTEKSKMNERQVLGARWVKLNG